MTTLSLKDAAFVADRPLFKDLTATFGPGDRVGLVAQNGAGKSTLLRCLAGETELTAGDITRSKGARIGYMPQAVAPELLDQTCRDAVLSGLAEPARTEEAWRTDMVLDTLDMPAEMRDRPFSELSGGWQRLILLARVWVADPDVLLMDEPTNHLDVACIAMLEDWLATWASGVPMIVASHDRRFLDTVTNRTLFLRPDESRLFALPYSRARAALDEADAAKAVEQERRLGEANKLRQQSAKLKNIGINSGSDLLLKKQKQLNARADAIEEAVTTRHVERAGEVRLADGDTHAKVLVRIRDLSVATPDGRPLFKVPELDIRPGDRMAVLGTNGSGKSTFMRLLRGVLIDGVEVDGIRPTPSLVTGAIDQALSDVPTDVSPMDFVTGLGVANARAHATLAGAGIRYDKQDRPIGTLSLGQRARLALMALRFGEPNFYLLDEPTNHLDIAGQEALADEVRNRGAGCVLVSHDRAFVCDAANRFFYIDGGRIRETPEPVFPGAGA